VLDGVLSHNADAEGRLVPVGCWLVRDCDRRIGGEHPSECLGGTESLLKHADTSRKLDMERDGIV